MHGVFYWRYHEGIKPCCWVVEGQAFYHWIYPHIHLQIMARHFVSNLGPLLASLTQKWHLRVGWLEGADGGKAYLLGYVSCVTRFVKISPLWINFKHRWPFDKGLFGIWQIFEPALAGFLLLVKCSFLQRQITRYTISHVIGRKGEQSIEILVFEWNFSRFRIDFSCKSYRM